MGGRATLRPIVHRHHTRREQGENAEAQKADSVVYIRIINDLPSGLALSSALGLLETRQSLAGSRNPSGNPCSKSGTPPPLCDAWALREANCDMLRETLDNDASMFAQVLVVAKAATRTAGCESAVRHSSTRQCERGLCPLLWRCKICDQKHSTAHALDTTPHSHSQLRTLKQFLLQGPEPCWSASTAKPLSQTFRHAVLKLAMLGLGWYVTKAFGPKYSEPGPSRAESESRLVVANIVGDVRPTAASGREIYEPECIWRPGIHRDKGEAAQKSSERSVGEDQDVRPAVTLSRFRRLGRVEKQGRKSLPRLIVVAYLRWIRDRRGGAFAARDEIWEAEEVRRGKPVYVKDRIGGMRGGQGELESRRRALEEYGRQQRGFWRRSVQFAVAADIAMIMAQERRIARRGVVFVERLPMKLLLPRPAMITHVASEYDTTQRNEIAEQKNKNVLQESGEEFKAPAELIALRTGLSRPLFALRILAKFQEQYSVLNDKIPELPAFPLTDA
ncbi:hypothetical protein C8R44DRAFT_725437 [Mycena epipterygia]|nr:hypothetical protein C8R44DRAFT_725437 [Mycena epipterygia]